MLYTTLRYEEEVSAKGTLKKSLLPPRWRLLMAQIIQCLGGKTGVHSEFASRYDASADSTAKADSGTSAPNDSLPPQQGKDEGTKNYSLNHVAAGKESLGADVPESALAMESAEASYLDANSE
nr:hypothetical protein [Tanacetum cinerariifolium]